MGVEYVNINLSPALMEFICALCLADVSNNGLT